MKRILLIALLGVTLIACKKEGCTSELAENYDSEAKTDDGTCIYPRDKFIGSYTISQDCGSSDVETFELTITVGPTEESVLIENFANENVTVKANIVNNELEYDYEVGYGIYSGVGYLVNEKLTLNFEVCEAYYYPCSDPGVCTNTGIKK